MARDVTADAPGGKLVSDITYIHTWAGFLHLATVIDCHTKGVINWAMADHMKTSLMSDRSTWQPGTSTLPMDAYSIWTAAANTLPGNSGRNSIL